MAEPGSLRERYRRVRFPSGHHPDADLAALHARALAAGFPAPDPESARVLELGCADGGHLAAMASRLPGAQFTGVDLVLHEPASGPNLELREQDLAEISGCYDYVLAIGLFSWVERPRSVIEAIERCLAPAGVAAVSFNVLPGWCDWLRARELLRFCCEGIDDPADQLAAAHQALRHYLRCEGDPALTPLAEGRWDAWLFHEFLAPFNPPMRLGRFVREVEPLRVLGLSAHDDLEDFSTGRKVRTELLVRRL